jgi:tRNA-splicing ligase RtcB
MIDRIADPALRAEIRTWLPVEEIEDGALQQLYNAARHPEAGEAIAVMPDCHVGYGVTIGCVFPTRNAVLPNAVGVDIGCGMCAVPTGVKLDRRRMDKQFWRDWSGQLARNVPTGFGTHRSPQDLGELDRPLRASRLQPLLREKAAVQLGTLGGGNHFLEAQVDEADQIWMMVHSGSRHTGLRIAGHYNDLAIASSTARGLDAPKDLASLPLDDATGQDYIHDMGWATDFALESRRQMIDQMTHTFAHSLERIGVRDYEPSLDAMINIHHNFAQLEEHGGERLMVHRKGATSADDGQLGIIPGSMGAPSYIVRGKGNEAALKSCSHGAGRQMGRNAAKKAITEAAFAQSLEGTFSKPSMRYVDEAPDAYKDITTVISRQQDLVEIIHTLKPIITLKGDSRAKED